jgi:DNA-binding NtrC family response regulator
MTQPQVHILVVDDERNTRKNLTMVLEAAGYKADSTGDAGEAILKCKQPYDIAFVDIQMPKMDGLEVLRYMRGLKPRMAVAMLTAYGTVSRAVDAMKLGAVDFIEKPFDPKNILTLCEEILQRQKIGMSGTVDELLRRAEPSPRAKGVCESPRTLKDRHDARPHPAGALLSASRGF